MNTSVVSPSDAASDSMLAASRYTAATTARRNTINISRFAISAATAIRNRSSSVCCTMYEAVAVTSQASGHITQSTACEQPGKPVPEPVDGVDGGAAESWVIKHHEVPPRGTVGGHQDVASDSSSIVAGADFRAASHGTSIAVTATARRVGTSPSPTRPRSRRPSPRWSPSAWSGRNSKTW